MRKFESLKANPDTEDDVWKHMQLMLGMAGLFHTQVSMQANNALHKQTFAFSGDCFCKMTTHGLIEPSPTERLNAIKQFSPFHG